MDTLTLIASGASGATIYLEHAAILIAAKTEAVLDWVENEPGVWLAYFVFTVIGNIPGYELFARFTEGLLIFYRTKGRKLLRRMQKRKPPRE